MNTPPTWCCQALYLSKMGVTRGATSSCRINYMHISMMKYMFVYDFRANPATPMAAVTRPVRTFPAYITPPLYSSPHYRHPPPAPSGQGLHQFWPSPPAPRLRTGRSNRYRFGRLFRATPLPNYFSAFSLRGRGLAPKFFPKPRAFSFTLLISYHGEAAQRNEEGQ